MSLVLSMQCARVVRLAACGNFLPVIVAGPPIDPQIHLHGARIGSTSAYVLVTQPQTQQNSQLPYMHK